MSMVTILDVNKATDDGALASARSIQIICTWLHTDNHDSILRLDFLQARGSSWHPSDPAVSKQWRQMFERKT